MPKFKFNNLSNFVAVFFLGAVFFMVSFMTVLAAEAIDSDQDGLSDNDELNIYHTNPLLADTDGDGFDDYTEIYNGYSPRHNYSVKLNSLDSDSDSVPDSWEIRLATDLLSPDSDGDGFTDSVEINTGNDPRSAEPGVKSKLIKVDIASQSLAYYFDDIKLEEFPISGGLSYMPTPEGNFTVLDKVPSKTYGGTGFDFYYPNTKWNLHFTTKYWRYYIHGAYWHNDFGKPKSHGCVNVAYHQMERLYNFAEIGTEIEII
ncbi:MAG: hypothetical protein CMI53_02010 [Parcubacteria group bacterium]|nr:hypothetical protein [Parcubacteria group bacterium]|tara:strand:+ start:3961 stop:4737 length:777 start_codon:yes stop_codon:yes gene_type:complete